MSGDLAEHSQTAHVKHYPTLYPIKRTPICVYAHARAESPNMLSLTTAQILLRPAYADDERAVHRLAALDSTTAAPAPPLLVAEIEGELRAALSLSDGSAIADPFYPSAELVALLRAHAAQAGARSLSPRAPRRRRRLAPSLARG
jgi:hypothetical protein